MIDNSDNIQEEGIPCTMIPKGRGTVNPFRNSYKRGYEHGDFVIASQEYFKRREMVDGTISRYFYYKVICSHCGGTFEKSTMLIRKGLGIKCKCHKLRMQNITDSEKKAASERKLKMITKQRKFEAQYEAWHDQLKQQAREDQNKRKIRRT